MAQDGKQLENIVAYVEGRTQLKTQQAPPQDEQ